MTLYQGAALRNLPTMTHFILRKFLKNIALARSYNEPEVYTVQRICACIRVYGYVAGGQYGDGFWAEQGSDLLIQFQHITVYIVSLFVHNIAGQAG